MFSHEQTCGVSGKYARQASSRLPSGCRSRRTGSSRRRRASLPVPRACITGRQRAARCSAPRAWCVNAGHCRPKIVEAVKRQVAEMDFAPTFQMGHPVAFEFAERLAQVAPPGFSRVFFTNSGSNRPTRPSDRACLPPGARRSRKASGSSAASAATTA